MRFGDQEFVLILRGLAPGRRRSAQLELLFQELTLPKALPVNRRGQARNARFAAKGSRTALAAQDDERVCPPQIPGQMVLLRPPRTLTHAHAHRIHGRGFAELVVLEQVLQARRARDGLSDSWVPLVLAMARLAMAARDPDEHQVRETDLAALPTMRGPLRTALAECGLLIPDTAMIPAPLHPRRPPVPCEHCLAWSGISRRICDSCNSWRRVNPVGTCQDCGRTLPISLGRCRFCRVGELERSLDPGMVPGQLWLGEEFARLTNMPGRDVKGTRERREQTARQATLRLSTHLVDPVQAELFPAPTRQWQRLRGPELLALTPAAHTLVEEFRALAKQQSWGLRPRKDGLRTLRLLVGHLGAAAPLREQDVRAAGTLSEHHGALRLLGFLQDKGLLVADPARLIDTHAAAVARLRNRIPKKFHADFDSWVATLRGQGRRPSTGLPWATIYSYTAELLPVLEQWRDASGIREITQDHVAAAARTWPRSLTPMKSLFKALKRERRIFRDPARAVKHVVNRPLPRPIPTGHLAGLLDAMPTPRHKVVFALIAIHAMRTKQISALMLNDLDRSTGRLQVRDSSVGRRGSAGRVVYLDEHTLLLIKDMLRERHERWPMSPNPHLIVSPVSAMHPDRPPIDYSVDWLSDLTGLTATQLRRDRILDEAVETADPVHLMRLFGISAATALTYLRTAYPEHFTIDPTEA